MSGPESGGPTSAWGPGGSGRLALVILGIAAAAILVYARSFSVPFVYDDLAEIVGNPDLHDLQDPWRIIGYNPARALLLLTFAVQWRFAGAEPLTYHVANLGIHLAVAALVAALTARLLRGRAAPSQAPIPWGPPALAALLFAVHPLFVETVTYIASRSESLCTAFYLAAVLAWSRYRDAQATGRPAARWYAATMLSMILAIATKEIAATLPAALLLFDLTLSPPGRTRVAAALPHVAPWLFLLGMVGLRLRFFGSISQGEEVRTVGENVLTEAGVILGYLYRYVVPWPLSIYHDVETVTSVGSVLPALAVHALVLALGVRLYRHGSPLAFVVGWFYLTLLPSSSVIPLKEAMAEHRAYLPGTAVLAGVGFLLNEARLAGQWPLVRTAGVAAAAVLGAVTFTYNGVWQDEIRLWRHATERAPHSGDAFYALGDAYRRQERIDEAIEAYTTSIRNYEDRGIHQKVSNSRKIVYNYPDALNNLGLAWAMRGDLDKAIAQFRLAARSYPAVSGRANTNLGYALMLKGQYRSAEAALTAAVEVDPGNALAHLHLANLYYAYLADRSRALEHYRAVLALDPDARGKDAINQRILELGY